MPSTKNVAARSRSRSASSRRGRTSATEKCSPAGGSAPRRTSAASPRLSKVSATTVSSTGRSELDQAPRAPADAEQAGADMRADHRADLGDEHRLGPEDLAAVLDEALRLVGRLDVLDDPAVGAVVAARAHVLDHALERAGRGAHPLDRDDLGLQRQDRLDLQRGADHGLRLADAPTALEVLERVDGEPDLQLGAHA